MKPPSGEECDQMSEIINACSKCTAPSSPAARKEIIEGFLALRDGREPPTDFARRDPPLPLNCCRRQPREVPR
jgi:hypothetical protein